MYLRSSDPTLTAANVVAKVVVIGFPFMYLRSSNPTNIYMRSRTAEL